MSEKLLRAARAAVAREDWVRAWHLTNAALNEEPDRPETLYLMGHILRQQGHVGLALPLFSKGLAFDQKQPNLWMNYGACLHDLNRWDEAIKAFTVVHAMYPDLDMPPANIAGSMVNLGKWHDAINWADKALAKNPENYIAQIAKTFACLAIGRWKDGWKHSEYLYGHHLDVRVYNHPEKEEPTWDGSKGKTVVVQCDQGIGDIIMFAQLFPRMAKECKKVIVETVDRLVPLFKRNFPQCDVYGTLKKTPTWVDQYVIDAHIHISALGRFYLNKDSDFERKPYISPRQDLVEKWKSFLADKPKPWVGIAWMGGIQQTHKHLRSVPISDFAPIINRVGTCIDMSYQDSLKDVSAWNIDNVKQVVKPPIDTSDFDDTVALCSVLDDVVCVTTTLLHVRGALGLPCKVLVPSTPQWREAHKLPDDSMIWYSPDSVKFFRQNPSEKDFNKTIERLIKEYESSHNLP